VSVVDFVSPQITAAFLILAAIAVLPMAARALKRRRH
jgi:hypothetical protein